jgi:tetratricopeptide (TPR) repeat protein
MKLLLNVFCLLLTFTATPQSNLDSLHDKLLHATEDTVKLAVAQKLAAYYSFNQFDSAIIYAREAIELADRLKNSLAKFECLSSVLFANNTVGNYSKALEIGIQMLRVAEQLHNHREKSLASAYHFIGLVNREMGYFQDAEDNLRRAIQIREQSLDPTVGNTTAYSQMAFIFLQKKTKGFRPAICTKRG